MFRAALTLLFTATTLLGPGMCCCAFASSTHTNPVTTADHHSVTKPVKSCCQQQSPPCGDHGKQEPGKPSKCPCEHGKQVMSLPADVTTTADLAAQLRLLDTLFIGLLRWVDHGLSTLASVALHTFEPVPRLAGRDLLAAYSLLRC